MAVLMILQVPGGTTELYDSIGREIGIDTADDLPDGCLAHAAAQTDDGIVIVDVWESPESFARFSEQKLAPATQASGIQGLEPRLIPVHNRIHAGRGRNAGVIGLFETPLTPDQYDEMVAKIAVHSGDGSEHPAVSHTAAVQDGTILVVDIWGSPEEFEEFASQISSALDGELPPMQVKFLPVHNHLRAAAPVTR
ncbi:MAG: hypothetical protein ACTHNU_04605 [Gaiellales bacterium]